MASKLPKRYFHLVFSITMAAGMAFVMTAVVTAVNVGLPADFLRRWMKAFGTAFVSLRRSSTSWRRRCGDW